MFIHSKHNFLAFLSPNVITVSFLCLTYPLVSLFILFALFFQNPKLLVCSAPLSSQHLENRGIEKPSCINHEAQSLKNETRRPNSSLDNLQALTKLLLRTFSIIHLL
jgi:hypothetical protein